MRLILVRHPPCLAGAGRCYGRLDLPVAATELASAAAQLRTQLPALPVFSSPLRRCLALARRLHARPTVLADLRELDFGRWEGQPWEAIDRSELDAWAADIWQYRPGGGENALELKQRWLRVYAHLEQQAPAGAILIAHAGLIRLALAEAGLLAGRERWAAPIVHATPYYLDL